DPYNFHVLSILGGGFLSTNDLREANSTLVCGQQAELMAPGTTTIITGVLPLRYLNPQLFDIVWKDGMKLLEAHASINMRRMLAPVRSDLLGERIAVLCCIMRQNYDLLKPVPQRDQEIFDDVSQQLKQLLLLDVNAREFEPLLAKLSTGASVRNYLAGSNAISCIYKPLIALLYFRREFSALYLSDIMAMLYEFDAHHVARHAFKDRDERNALLQRLFHVNAAKFIVEHPLSTVPPLDDGEHRNANLEKYVRGMVDEHITADVLFALGIYEDECKTWMRPLRDFAGYYRFLSFEDQLHIPRAKQLLYLVAALQCDCEQSRIVNGESVTFAWNDEESE